MRARELARHSTYHSMFTDTWINRSRRRYTAEYIASLSISVRLNGSSFKVNSSTKRGTVKQLTKLYRGRS